MNDSPNNPSPIAKRKLYIPCRPLADVTATNLNTVRTAFASATPCELAQAWRTALQPGFAPGSIRTGWQPEALLVLAELTDYSVTTKATAPNQRMWELGDTFEMFFQPANQTEYLEFHVTPNNQHLQLRIPSTAALRAAQAANTIEPFLLAEHTFESRTWLEPENRKWFVFARIPVPVVAGTATLNAGSHWKFSFSRYDYTRGGGDPIISSTSPHAIADFHRQQEWGKLSFIDEL